MKFGCRLAISLIIFLFERQNLVHAATLREATTVTCSEGHTETVDLRSTERLAGASGEARLERNGRSTDIEVEIRAMRPASLFGGDYNTYVLWIVSPDRQMVNLGELLLEGNRSRIHSTTRLTTFAILITAEPHYLASTPSAFVVLENKPNKRSSRIQHPVVEGVYNFQRSNLDDVKEAKGKVHTEVKQAFTAFRLAERAGAADFATYELRLAGRSLDETLHLSHTGIHRNELEAQARHTVRLAVAAQHLAQDRTERSIREVTGNSSRY